MSGLNFTFHPFTHIASQPLTDCVVFSEWYFCIPHQRLHIHRQCEAGSHLLKSAIGQSSQSGFYVLLIRDNIHIQCETGSYLLCTTRGIFTKLQIEKNSSADPDPACCDLSSGRFLFAVHDLRYTRGYSQNRICLQILILPVAVWSPGSAKDGSRTSISLPLSV